MDRTELLTWLKRNNPNGVPQPPQPGSSPSFTSGSPSRASLAATR